MPEPEAPQIIAGDSAVLARRYANALYALAEEKKQLDTVAADLRAFRESVQDNHDFQKMVHNPRLSRLQLAAIMQQLAEQSKMGEVATLFLALLARKRRLDHLHDITGMFLNELATKRGEYTVEVQTAQALTDEQQEQLIVQLNKITGGKVRLIVKEDASLLGGLIVKWGSRLIDASIKGKLEQIERQLKAQEVAAVA